jgi:hypothetical protein
MSGNKSKFRELMLSVGMPVGLLLILAGLLAPFFFVGTLYAESIYKYVYAVGALVLCVAGLCHPRGVKDLRLRRLYRLDAMSALLFVAAIGILLSMPYGGQRDWITLTLAGAAMKIYTTIAIPNRLRKL